jgi:hypothetical protein
MRHGDTSRVNLLKENEEELSESNSSAHYRMRSDSNNLSSELHDQEELYRARLHLSEAKRQFKTNQAYFDCL